MYKYYYFKLQRYIRIRVFFSVACTIKIDDITLMTTGGNQPGSWVDTTWIYNFETKQWTSGPKMNNERDGHACAKFDLGGETVLMVSGGYKSGGYIDSVEFLNWHDEHVWIEGIFYFKIRCQNI